MHAVDLIASALPEAEREPLPQQGEPGTCCVTGAATQTIARKNLFGKSYTDQACLKAPDSDRAGIAAWWALTHKWERMSSWVCDGKTFARLNRQQVREHVILGVERPQPWAGYITTSYKKHGSLHAPVNGPGRQVWRFEMLTVDASDRGRVESWWRAMLEWQRRGIGRQTMETNDCPVGVLRKLGAEVWVEYQAWSRGKRNSPLFALLCYLLPSLEELKGGAA